MRIAIDIDCVLLDIMPSIIKWHNENYGFDHAFEMFKQYSLDKTWGCSFEEAVKRVNQFYDSEDFKHLKVISNAPEVVKQLSKKQDLFVITSRPERIRKITEKQLNAYFPNCFDDIHFTSEYKLKEGIERNKKFEICNSLNADYLIEDCLEHIQNFSNGVKAILLDSPWNQGEIPSYAKRFYSWKEIGAFLSKE